MGEGGGEPRARGPEADAPRRRVYIGEAENVLVRLRSHLKDAKKDFWDQVVFFSSKDENLTKAHVKYLEARMIALAQENGRVALENGNIFAEMMETAKVCTMGQISNALYEIGGQYRRSM